MISYYDALDLLESTAKIIESECVCLLNCLQRITSKDIYAPIFLPSFDNSAMDGFAVHSKDVLLASSAKPIYLEVVDIIQAKPCDKTIAKHGNVCSEIMTGSAIPLGYDAVIPIENVTTSIINGIKYIEVNNPIKQGANIRIVGEDVKEGQLIIKANTALAASHVALLASLGINKVEVYKKINIAIMSSGEEITDDYNDKLQFGQIYNSNSQMLMALTNSNLFDCVYCCILRDTKKSLVDFVQQNNQQILITTGAVSKGKWDFIPDALRFIGAQIVFHGVCIRPGKPILFAILPSGQYFFGLPGNPVSSMVGFRFFVIPLIRKLLGKNREMTKTAFLAKNYVKKHPLRHFLKAQLNIKCGRAIIDISEDQESFKIHALTKSNVWAIASESQHELNSDELIEFVPFYSDFSEDY